jgi:hypothetical protein
MLKNENILLRERKIFQLEKLKYSHKREKNRFQTKKIKTFQLE